MFRDLSGSEVYCGKRKHKFGSFFCDLQVMKVSAAVYSQPKMRLQSEISCTAGVYFIKSHSTENVVPPKKSEAQVFFWGEGEDNTLS